MDTLISLTDQFILIYNNTKKNLVMENLRELQKLKLKRNRKIRKGRKKIKMILLFGKLLNLVSQNGHLIGEKDAQDGI